MCYAISDPRCGRQLPDVDLVQHRHFLTSPMCLSHTICTFYVLISNICTEYAQTHGNLCAVDTWESRHAHQIGIGIQRRRKALALSAQQLCDLTEKLGLKLTRQSIADLENGRRRYVTTAELSILAAALDIPPILLLFPRYPDGNVEVIPGEQRTSRNAAAWFCGTEPGPTANAQANPGVLLLTLALNDLDNAKNTLLSMRIQEPTEDNSSEITEAITHLSNEVHITEQHLNLIKSKIWDNHD